ncbi:pimeloyl-ACP methyl ester carboxylesterase [Actinoplanes lutulentus]|uniref:Pimeloyl-ACP methyl ester carboxylesterase n=1 Tax=Actinoplanes lutulentus TaxID=1287878 RepID=A0A327Z1Y2_9ACTN|nr:alpha/beta fold hydrolase [Actinoplanes lutulentus]MBB2946301.1 pimeloyl-ACP methyl ester carboxylesterase [Actinoplanes lutulentus]RAK28760.1 pimeloyl-ACP methyl ester carboxylesterase [Actinoplanes lutulentus]
MTGKPPFVLVHGGRHGGWAWRRVATPLRRAGHDVHTPTLTGLGERAHLLGPAIGLDTHIADLVAVFEYEDLADVVLVAHSYGGAVACGAMEQVADRVRSLVLVDAHMPESGQSVLDLVGPERAAALRQRVKEQGEGWFVPVSDASWWGLTDPGDIAWVNTKITAQPMKTYEDPAPSTERARASAYTFIECSRSRLPADERAWQRSRCQDSATRRYRVVEGSHDVMVDAPEALVALLLEAQDPPGAG